MSARTRVTTPMRVLIALAVLAAFVLAACGGSDDQLSQDASARLQPLVAEVRAHALGYDPAGTRQALVAVRDAVLAMRNDDSVGAARVHAMLTAIDAVERKLPLVPTTTTTTTAPPRPTNRGDEGDQGKGKGGGKGEG